MYVNSNQFSGKEKKLVFDHGSYLCGLVPQMFNAELT